MEAVIGVVLNSSKETLYFISRIMAGIMRFLLRMIMKNLPGALQMKMFVLEGL